MYIAIFAKYLGNGVLVGGKLSPSDLSVSALKEDNSLVTLGSAGYAISPKTINALGTNVITITSVEGACSTTVLVPGLRTIASMTATYEGQPVAIGNEYESNAVSVRIQYTDGTYMNLSQWTTDTKTVTKAGTNMFQLFYEGVSCELSVPGYERSLSQLYASYSGPDVVPGDLYQTKYVTILGKYSDNELVSIPFSEISTPSCIVTRTGNNVFVLSYQGLTTEIVVFGANETTVSLLYITATYQGSSVSIGNSLSLHKIQCLAYYSNKTTGSIVDFSIANTIVTKLGINHFRVSYEGKECDLIVIGVEKESTTSSGEQGIETNLQYPEAERINHRYRGPVESEKLNKQALFLESNLRTLYETFDTIEASFRTQCVKIRAADGYRASAIKERLELVHRIEERR